METVKVALTNRQAVLQCPPDTQLALKPHFRFRVPGCEYSERYRMGVWDGYRNLMRRGCVPAGLFLEMQRELESEFRLEVDDRRVSPALHTAETPSGMRGYQQEAVDAMLRNSATGGLVLAATGSGKTFLAGAYLRHLQGSACFIVDELTLLEQARREISSVLAEEVGTVGRSRFEPRRVTVATIQTLHKHRHKPEFAAWHRNLEVLIIDEIHLALNRRNLDVVHEIKPKAVFGLTATLEMEKPHVRLPAVALAGPVIYTYPIRQGVEEGYLSRGMICRLRFWDTLRGRAPEYPTGNGWVEAGSKDADYRWRVVLSKDRNGCVEGLVREAIRRGRRTIVLVERLAHLKILSRRMEDVPHRVLCGAYKQEDRSEAVRQMDGGKLPLILASRVFSKGVDIRTVDTIIDATALPGRNSAIQRYGRGVRMVDGKRGLIYIDIADLGNRFAATARLRNRALREVGAPILDQKWEGDAGAVFDRLEGSLNAGAEKDDMRLSA